MTYSEVHVCHPESADSVRSWTETQQQRCRADLTKVNGQKRSALATKSRSSELVSGGVVFFDQGLYSATNFVLAVATVRYFELAEIGVFALSVTFVRYAIEIVRAAFSEPLLLLESRIQSGGYYLRASLFVHLLAGLGFAALASSFAAVGWMLGWSSTPVVLSIGIVLPVVLCQDAMRFVSFATIPKAAVWADAAMFAVLLVFIGLVPKSLPAMILGWGLSSAISLAIGFALLREPTVESLPWRRFREIVAPRGRVFLVEAIFERGLGQATLFVIAVMVGVAGSGQIHSGRLVFGLLNIALMGLAPALTPILVRRRSEYRSVLSPLVVAGSVSTVIVALVAVAAWLDPWSALSSAMADGVYREVQPLLPWIGGGIWLGIISLLVVTYLRVADLTRFAFFIRLGTNLLVLAGAIAGAAVGGGPLGVVAGMTIARAMFVLSVMVHLRVRSQTVDLTEHVAPLDLTHLESKQEV